MIDTQSDRMRTGASGALSWRMLLGRAASLGVSATAAARPFGAALAAAPDGDGKLFLVALEQHFATRIAVVYIRKSTPAQVRDNLEGLRRQYDLVEVARRHGCAVIDDDLGQPASGAVARPGFERLVARLCAGEIGAVLCFKASRVTLFQDDLLKLLRKHAAKGPRRRPREAHEMDLAD